MQMAEEINVLRSRSPVHADDLIDFSSDFFKAAGIARDRRTRHRLRKVACYLADIGWRGHPDYRGEQSGRHGRLWLG